MCCSSIFELLLEVAAVESIYEFLRFERAEPIDKPVVQLASPKVGVVAGRPAELRVAVDRLDGLRFDEAGVGFAQKLGAAHVRHRPQALAACNASDI